MFFRSCLKAIAIALAPCALALQARAAFETRNGGYGVEIEDQIVSYDLFLAERHHNPYLSAAVVGLGTPYLDAVKDALTDVVAGDELAELVAQKLAHLRFVAAKTGREAFFDRAVDAMSLYSWLGISLNCTDVNDETDPTFGKLQVAYRQEHVLRFCADFYRMALPQQAALVVHEIIYLQSDDLGAVETTVGFAFDPALATDAGAPRLAQLIDDLETPSVELPDAFVESDTFALDRAYLTIRSGFPLAGLKISTINPLVEEYSYHVEELVGSRPYRWAREDCLAMKLGGLTGWRLPTEVEAKTLMQLGITERASYNTQVWFEQGISNSIQAMPWEVINLHSGIRMIRGDFVEANLLCVK